MIHNNVVDTEKCSLGERTPITSRAVSKLVLISKSSKLAIITIKVIK